jgi:deazaflavin-dependent oxidoreductase (nitroreductase family)
MNPARGGPVQNRLVRVVAGLLRVRWLMRAPIWIYRARLGAVFGVRLLMLEHVGRKSGRRRHVVLEVVDRPEPGTYVVVSGFGEGAQWYRNVEADPHVRVYLRSHRPVAAEARPLSAEESGAALRRYASAHPRAWSSLRPVLEHTLGTPIDEDGTELPMLALRCAY